MSDRVLIMPLCPKTCIVLCHGIYWKCPRLKFIVFTCFVDMLHREKPLPFSELKYISLKKIFWLKKFYLLNLDQYFRYTNIVYSYHQFLTDFHSNHRHIDRNELLHNLVYTDILTMMY